MTCVDSGISRLKQNLQQLATEYPALTLPSELKLDEILNLVDVPLKTLLRETLTLLKQEFPKIIPLPYETQGLHAGFITDLDVLSWLHFLLTAKLTVDDALTRLTDLPTMKSLEAEVYVFFLGLDAIEFGAPVSFGNFVIGRAMQGGPIIDGRWMQFIKASALDFYIKTPIKLPVAFGTYRLGFDHPHVVSAVLDGLSGELSLLEAERGASLQPFAFHVRLDPFKTPLTRAYDRMIEIAGDGRAAFGRLPSPPLTRDAIVRLWESYAALSEDSKTQLRPVLRWISKSLHMDEAIDAMIAVGTSLEVLFLDRELTEQLAYRISLNGSLWLEDDPAKRLDVQRRLKTAYTARSKSVHGVAKKVDDSVVSEARDLAVRATLLALERGGLPINWNDWIIGRFPSTAIIDLRGIVGG
jgi:hypothetical protein